MQESGCDLVIGFGGAALDTARAAAAPAVNPGDPLDYLEVVGANRALTHPSLPCIAIPTTASTGSEVTLKAVISVPTLIQPNPFMQTDFKMKRTSKNVTSRSHNFLVTAYNEQAYLNN